jgi:hypothetical protein
MSNVNNPHGFRPLGWNLGGGPPVIVLMSKAAGLGTAIYPFDLVARLADGSITSATASITPGTTLISGVALDYGALSTATDHLIMISPDALFEGQDNAGGAGILAADLQLNCNVIVSVAGTLATKKRGHQIADSTKDVTSTLDLHLLQLLNVPDNAFGPNARIVVVINKHRMNPGVAGV